LVWDEAEEEDPFPTQCNVISVPKVLDQGDVQWRHDTLLSGEMLR